MKVQRSTIVRRAAVWALGAATVACGPVAGAAEAWPAKPVRLVVGFAAGGANDLVARVVAQRLGPQLGTQVVIDNRPGAGGNLATEIVARSAPDGYTLLLGSVSSLGMGPGLYGSVPYDPVKDFAPVSQAVSAGTLLAVHPSMPVRSLKEFIALVRREPGKIDVAFPGNGSIAHIAAEVFKKTAGLNFVLVPYKGGAPALTDVLAGQVTAMMSVLSTPAPYVQSGRLRGLAVTTARRAKSLPDIPTIAESGYPDYEVNGWMGLLYPANTPAAIVTRTHKEMLVVLALPETRERLENVGMDVEASATPDQFRALIQRDLARWTKIIREIDMKLN
jgi:tripartite-type tricarboxylate transporter receptor subunit TctC